MTPLGIVRALVEADPELRVALKRQGFLARDLRIVERKEAGLKKWRKTPQRACARGGHKASLKPCLRLEPCRRFVAW
jgi:Ribosomal protein S9/S16